MNTRFFFIMLLAATAWSQNTWSNEFQSHESIYAAARDLIARELDTNNDREITFSNLDPRLQLSVCEQPLEAFTSTQAIKPGRNAIGVKCTSIKSWSLYVSAQIKVYQDVVALTQSVNRGEILTENQLSTSRMDISQIRTPFISDINLAIHKQAAHNLSQGAILYQRDITQAILIKRGETVVISSTKAYLSIQMQGIALTDGAQGQSIRIKNLSSNRIISAVVSKQGVVSVDF
ncbi:MAG: flagellar basal body P-ring formation chaperone FlgA [Methylococcaceae bacterium]